MMLLEKQVPQAPLEASMDQFLQQFRSIPRLTPEEERQRARRCAAGDEEALRTMVSANLRLVVSVAKEYAGRGVAILDLIQEGSIGLLTAARKFDHTLNFRFSTYATKWIRRGIIRCLISHAGLIRVPENMAEQMHKIQLARSVLLQETGEVPTLDKIAERSGFSPEKVKELMVLEPEICSLDIPTGEDSGGTLGNLIEDSQAPQPQQKLVRRELEQMMDRLLGALEPRQRQILRLHFGMEDGCCYSLEQIGKQLGISKERTRQIERHAMEKLQKMGASMGLEDFLNE